MLARMAFPRCTATDKRCRRYSVDFGSPDSSDIRRPSSLNNVNDFGPINLFFDTLFSIQSAYFLILFL